MPQLLEEYLARGPETGTLPLVSRSLPMAARAAFLLYGMLARDGSVGWLAVFLLAELLLVLCLMRLGNRIAGRPAPEAESAPKVGAAAAAGWAALALGATYLSGLRLEASSGGLWFGGGIAAGAAGWWSWAVAGYLALELAEFAREVAVARSGGRRFVSTSTISAAFFFVALCLAPILYFLMVYVFALLSRPGAAREALAVALVLAKLGAELGVLWFPRLAKSSGLRPRSFGSGAEPPPRGSGAAGSQSDPGGVVSRPSGARGSSARSGRAAGAEEARSRSAAP